MNRKFPSNKGVYLTDVLKSESFWDLNGTAIKVFMVFRMKCRIGKKPFFYFADKNEAIDLDNKEDFKYLEYYVSKNLLG